MIEIYNVWKSFGKNHVLCGVDLEVKEGETLVIIGRSGCGKSVLLKHIIGLMKPDKGIVIVDGEDITKVRRDKIYEMRHKFGMLFQGAALFDSLTVGENVGLAIKEHRKTADGEVDRIVAEKLRLVGLSGIERMKPAELSGGMKKRVGLARAIARNPKYILYDEPTTGLDPIMADKINELIRQLQRELSITSIAVTHDMTSAFKIGDRVAMLYGGKIIFQGTPQEIQRCENPIVQQFIQGRSEGPIEAG